eukprot:SAG31_NODE_795_length_12036_cov_28.879953_8_plen_307_part_00
MLVPGNLDPPDQLVHIEPLNCAALKAECVGAAHKACEASADCMSFAIFTQNGNPDTASRAQLFRAGVGNTVEGGGWQLYSKAKPCSSCAGGSVAAQRVPRAPKAWPQHRQCIHPGNAFPCGHTDAKSQGECQPAMRKVAIYCVQSHWGFSFLAVVALLSVGYLGGGIAVGRRRAAGVTAGPAGLDSMLRLHPHWRSWVELCGLVGDGVAFVQRNAVQAPKKRRERLLGNDREHESKFSESAKEKKKKTTMTTTSKSTKQSKSKGTEQDEGKKENDGGEKNGAELQAPLRNSGTAAAGGGRWVHIKG